MWCTIPGFIPGTEVHIASIPKMLTKDVYIKLFSGPLCHFLLFKDIVHYIFAKYTCSKLIIISMVMNYIITVIDYVRENHITIFK